MNRAEYKRRDTAAAARLESIGELENARLWLKHAGDEAYRAEAGEAMTPMEWAELEMPVGLAGSLLRLVGLF